MGEYAIYMLAGYAAVLAYLAWRIHACVKRRLPLQQEAAWAVYLIVSLPLLSRMVPTGAGDAVLLVAWLLASAAISYQVNRRYHRWLEKEARKTWDREA